MRHLLALCLLSWAFTTHAQVYESTSQEVTPEEAQELFSVLKRENAKMGEHSECFERAHLWARHAEVQQNVVMEKVFLYFTYKFDMRHRVTNRWPWSRPFTWWFHVAPAVKVNGELWVMDATFTDEAMPLQQWAGSLMQNPEACVPMDNPNDYVTDRNSSLGRGDTADVPQCYYTVAPRFVYQPLEMGLRDSNNGMTFGQVEAVPADWQGFKLNWALKAYKSQHRRAARQALNF